MPTYLLHGFRWPRPLIRIHIILQNLDDAAAEWLMAPPTAQALVTNFTSLYPELMPSLPRLRFIEQYDPLDESAESKSQPYAYVADTVHEVKLGVDVDEVRGRGVGNDTWTSMVELRDNLAPGEKVAWFVVVCGDVERWAPPTMTAIEENNGNGYQYQYPLNGGSVGSVMSDKRSSTEQTTSTPPMSRGLKKFFSMKSLRKSKSMKSISAARRGSEASSLGPVPPLPTSPHLPPPSQHGNQLPILNGRTPPSSNDLAPGSPPLIPGTAV